MRPCGRDWGLAASLDALQWIKGVEIHVPWCSYEARDKFLIMFYTRPCDETSSLTAPKFLVRDLSCRKKICSELTQAKNDSIIGSLEFRARARSLGCTRDKKQNWKAGQNQCCLLLQNLPLCVTLLLWVCGFLQWTGLLPYFCLLRLPSSLKHSSRTCPWNVKYQELLVSGYNT